MAGEASPPDINPKYVAALQGICPNTGQRCEKLGDLRFTRSVVNDSFGMGFGEGNFDAMTKGQREAFERVQEEGGRMADLTQRAIDGDCIGACALEGVDVSAYISGK